MTNPIWYFTGTAIGSGNQYSIGPGTSSDIPSNSLIVIGGATGSTNNAFLKASDSQGNSYNFFTFNSSSDAWTTGICWTFTTNSLSQTNSDFIEFFCNTGTLDFDVAVFPSDQIFVSQGAQSLASATNRSSGFVSGTSASTSNYTVNFASQAILVTYWFSNQGFDNPSPSPNVSFSNSWNTINASNGATSSLLNNEGAQGQTAVFGWTQLSNGQTTQAVLNISSATSGFTDQVLVGIGANNFVYQYTTSVTGSYSFHKKDWIYAL